MCPFNPALRAPSAVSVAAKPQRPQVMARRVDVAASQLGFLAPPCDVHLKFLPLGSGWTVVALTAPGKPPVAARWLEAYSPVSIHIGTGLSPRVFRANFDKIPAPWTRMLGNVVVHYLELCPDGSASLFIEDSPEKVERFVADLRTRDPTARFRQTHAGPTGVRLTRRQLEIVSLAVALGYYEIPHKLHLRALAKKVGLGVGAASELLRRGEALIVTNYIDTLSESEWQIAADAATSTSHDSRK